MDWINLHTSFLDSPVFLGSEPVDRATWLCLLRYCVGQENGGTIEGAALWGDRKWQQLVRVTLDEAKRVSDLWVWDGDNLRVTAYPMAKETEIQAMRKLGKTISPAKAAAARENGVLGGRPKSNPTGNPTASVLKTQHKTHQEPIEGEGKGRVIGIGIGKEGEQKLKTPSETKQAISALFKPSNPPCPVPPFKKLTGTPDAWWMDLREGERSLLIASIHISPKGGDSWKRDITALQYLVSEYGFDRTIHTAKPLVHQGALPYASKVLQALKEMK